MTDAIENGSGDSEQVSELPPFTLEIDKEHRQLRLTEMDELEFRRTDRKIKVEKQLVKNRIAIVLIGAFVVSLPVVLGVLAFSPASKDQVIQVYIHWLTVLASLAGAAIGVNAMTSSQ